MKLLFDHNLSPRLVSYLSDYNDLSLLRGFPPKVIWIRRGNCSTKEIEQLIRSVGEAIQSLESCHQWSSQTPLMAMYLFSVHTETRRALWLPITEGDLLQEMKTSV